MGYLDSVWIWLGDHYEAIIAISALCIALWQGWIARKHNRLSVTPYLTTFTYHNVSDDLFELQVELSNNGVGPAKIEEYQIFLDGKPIRARNSDDFNAVLDQLFPGHLVSRATATLTEHYMMRAHEIQTILEIKAPARDADTIKKTLDSRLSLLVRYKCIYGIEQKPLDSRTMPHLFEDETPESGPQNTAPSAGLSAP